MAPTTNTNPYAAKKASPTKKHGDVKKHGDRGPSLSPAKRGKTGLTGALVTCEEREVEEAPHLIVTATGGKTAMLNTLAMSIGAQDMVEYFAGSTDVRTGTVVVVKSNFSKRRIRARPDDDSSWRVCDAMHGHAVSMGATYALDFKLGGRRMYTVLNSVLQRAARDNGIPYREHPINNTYVFPQVFVTSVAFRPFV
jgi:hypothetical protein